MGAWQGLTAAQVADRWPDVQDALARGEDVRRGDHGETAADVADRVGAALDGAPRDPRPGPVPRRLHPRGVGSHRRRVAARTGPEVAWRVLGPLGNCHWAELVEARAGWRIQTWNASSGGASQDGFSPP